MQIAHLAIAARHLARYQILFAVVAAFGACLSLTPQPDDLASEGIPAASQVPTDPANDSSPTTGTARQNPPAAAIHYALTDGVALQIGRLRDSNCLAAANGQMAAGNYVTVAACDGSLSQQWKIQGGRYQLQNNVCMAADSDGSSALLQTCSDDPNQRFISQRGFMLGVPSITINGLSCVLSSVPDAATGAVYVAHRYLSAQSDPNHYCITPSATPRGRGFAIRPDGDPNYCLQLTGPTVSAAPCVASNPNQRWLLDYGLLTSLADVTVVVAPAADGNSIVVKSRTDAASSVDGFWLGERSDFPSMSVPPHATSNYNIYFDAVTKAVTYTPNTTQSFWQFGGSGTP